MKRILSIALALCMMLGCAALLGGCNGEKGDNWPVTVGNVTIDKEPQNIVVLSDKLADIVSYIGYDVKMVGRSTECDQDFLYIDRKSTRLNSSHPTTSRMPSSA